MSSKISIRSPRTEKMYDLMERSDGSMNLREMNIELFHQAVSWESMVMAAVVWNKGAQILGKITTGEEARAAWACVVNIFEGVPGGDEIVRHFRSMLAIPEAMDDSQWIELSRKTALGWSRDVEQFLDGARRLKTLK